MSAAKLVVGEQQKLAKNSRIEDYSTKIAHNNCYSNRDIPQQSGCSIRLHSFIKRLVYFSSMKRTK